MSPLNAPRRELLNAYIVWGCIFGLAAVFIGVAVML